MPTRLLVMLVAICAFGISSTTHAQTTKKPNATQQTQADAKSLAARIEALESEVKSLKAEIAELKRHLAPAKAAPASSPTESAKEPILVVTDTKGVKTTLSNCNIDYTRVFNAFTDFENDGIRVVDGDATTTVPWKRIKVVNVILKNDKDTRPRLEATIEFTDSKSKSVELVSGKLRGDSDIGRAQVSFESIKSIERKQ